jgi:hypothetical protein
MSGQAQRQAEFGTPGQRHRTHRHQRSDGREGGRVRDGGIDAHLRARALFEMIDQAIERLIGAVLHIIIIAREQGDPDPDQPIVGGRMKGRIDPRLTDAGTLHRP